MRKWGQIPSRLKPCPWLILYCWLTEHDWRHREWPISRGEDKICRRCGVVRDE